MRARGFANHHLRCGPRRAGDLLSHELTVVTEASAPGKLVLAGEYAVAFGGPGIVTAVDRRAVARFDGDARQRAGSLPYLDALEAALPSASARELARCIVVDSQEFFQHGTKLGLGSSAAVVVAAAALALGNTATLDEVLAVARTAHHHAQSQRGAGGSGIDLVASTFGGTLRVQSGNTAPVQIHPDLQLIPFFLGHSADTAHLLAIVTTARAASPSAIEPILDGIAEVAEQLSAGADSSATIALFDRGAELIEKLGAATGLALAPPVLLHARAMAHRHGGTAKTCGAGGGDLAIAVLPNTVEASAFRSQLLAVGGTPVDLRLGQPGVLMINSRS